METCHDLCKICAAGYTKLRPYLEGQVPNGLWLGQFRWWDLPGQLKEDCSLCRLLPKLQHGSCDGASHEYAFLDGYTVPHDNLVQPPAATTIYLQFGWSCGTKQWYFFENDEKHHLKGTIGFAHQIEPKLDETDWEAIRHCVNGCLQQGHSGCISPDPIDLPGFEVIDCKARKLVYGGEATEFAALSYVWGFHRAEGVLQDRRTLPNPFPEQLIEDALACASKLNIPYLWVDRYCIDQNDTSQTKHRLIQSMDRIYSAAKVTIIDAAGDDASTGLPGVSTTLRAALPRRAVVYGRKMIPVINPNHKISTSKWARRGWTLQEGLLARRRLVFTNTQVYFQCTQSHCIESLLGAFRSDGDLYAHHGLFTTLREPRLATQAFPSSVIGSSSSNFSIVEVCNEFARRDLTADKDALKACLGVFSRLWASEKPTYQYHGLPFQANSSTAFAVSLLWEFDNAHGALGSEQPTKRTWGSSWSWVAFKGRMDFERSGWNKDPAKFKLFVDIKLPFQHDGQEIMSTVDDYIRDINAGGLYQDWLPYLRLSGWITTMRFETTYGKLEPNDLFLERINWYPVLDQTVVGHGRLFPAMVARAAGTDQVCNSMLLNVVFIAFEGSMNLHGLVIHRVGEEEEHKYERLGTCTLRLDSPTIRDFQNMSHMTVKEYKSEATRNLECKFETITLV